MPKQRSAKLNRAIFIDRDGVINELVDRYVTSWRQFRFLPNSLKALKKLANSDYKIIIITNQSAVGRGLLQQETVQDIHSRMLAKIQAQGGRIDGIFMCAHKPEDYCGCRKPKIGLLKLAASSFNIDLKNSWFVGDNTMDIKTGRNAGCRTILVKTGYGGKDGLFKVKPNHIAENLLDAINIVL
jgi:D-glycero-D-manno-heptose 1,7-bisphosphate phosphatase